ncbi:hypothetical protein LguiB_011753 [Lonicera macranthoides]
MEDNIRVFDLQHTEVINVLESEKKIIGELRSRVEELEKKREATRQKGHKTGSAYIDELSKPGQRTLCLSLPKRRQKASSGREQPWCLESWKLNDISQLVNMVEFNSITATPIPAVLACEDSLLWGELGLIGASGRCKQALSAWNFNQFARLLYSQLEAIAKLSHYS